MSNKILLGKHQSVLEECERALLIEALKAHSTNADAARSLGISRTKFLFRCEKLGINRDLRESIKQGNSNEAINCIDNFNRSYIYDI